MRFHLVDHDSKPHILDVETKRIYGPYPEERAMSALSYALKNKGIRHKTPTDLKPTDCRLVDLERLNALIDSSNPDDETDFVSLMREHDPLPGWLVRWARLRLGLSQGDLAGLLGSNETEGRYRTVQDWELGNRNCTGKSRLAIIELVGS